MDNHYYLVRHGTTHFNENKIFMGTMDSPLTLKGIKEAQELYARIKDIPFDIAYISPSSRAYNTAMIALGFAVPIIYDDGTFTLSYLNPGKTRDISLKVENNIMEKSFGIMQGTPRDDLVERYPEYIGVDLRTDYYTRFEGGESYKDLERRIFKFLNSLEEMHEGKRIIIFTHKGPVRMSQKYFEGLTEEQATSKDPEHCCLIEYHS